jgi:ATP:ADP antiporter, AAA family
MGANVALIFSGQYVRWVSNMRSTLAPGVDAWAVSLKFLMAAVVGSGGVLIAAYKYMQDKIVSQKVELAATKKFPRKKKARMSMKESAKVHCYEGAFCSAAKRVAISPSLICSSCARSFS